MAYFDIYTDDDAAEFNGAWSNYPFFGSGIVVVSGIEQGLFVLAPNLAGGGDAAPSVTLVNPAEGETVSGSVLIQIDADDAEDTAGTLTVEWSVDGGDPQPTDYNSTTGLYEATWDSKTVSDGGHTVTARAIDSGGNTATDSNNVTVDNEADPAVHVGDLDGASSNGKGRWTATVTIEVHDESHSPVGGATVSGSWSTGGSASCDTGTDGRCSVSVSLRKNVTQTTFTVADVVVSGAVYDATQNHDPDSDSDGTSITVTGP